MHSPGSMKTNLLTIFTLHNRRMLAYKDLDCAFKTYLAGRASPENECCFQYALSKATTTFQEISNGIIEAKQVFQHAPFPVARLLAESVDRIQELESQRLKITVEYQMHAGKCRDSAVAMRGVSHINGEGEALVDTPDYGTQLCSIVTSVEELIVALREDGEDFLVD